jgi:cobalt-zinc-cadmium efflux system protein
MTIHVHTEGEQTRAFKKALTIAFFFMAIELIGGWVAHSLALISDALHLFTDVGALFLGLIVVMITRKPRTPRMSYGYHRAEIIGALASALTLWILCGFLIYEAIERLVTPQNVDGPVVFVIAAIGIVANIWMMRVLHHTHHHNLNTRAAYLHVIGDLVGSIGVLLGGAILWLTGWDPIDPIITLLFTAGILFGSFKIIRHSTQILMESAPDSVDPTAIERDLLALPGVKEVHDLHIWSVSTKRLALSAHIISTAPAQETLKSAHQIIEKKHQIHHMTFQVEDPSHFQPEYCYDKSRN